MPVFTIRFYPLPRGKYPELGVNPYSQRNLPLPRGNFLLLLQSRGKSVFTNKSYPNFSQDWSRIPTLPGGRVNFKHDYYLSENKSILTYKTILDAAHFFYRLVSDHEDDIGCLLMSYHVMNGMRYYTAAAGLKYRTDIELLPL